MTGAKTCPALLVALVVIALVVPAAADEMKFERFPVTIHFEPHNRRVAEKVQQIIDRDAGVLAAQLGLNWTRPIEIRIEDDIAPYRQRLRGLPEWGVAFAVMEDQLIVVDVKRATRAMNSLDHVVPHELSHLYIAQRAPGVRFPIWFLEGLAQWQAHEWSMIDSWQLMNAVWGNDAPDLLHLTDTYPTGEERARNGYRMSYAAFTDLFSDRPDELPRFVDRVVELGHFEQAFADYFGVDFPTYAVEFHRRLESRYHSRLLVFQTGPLFSILAVVFLIIGLRFYIRKKRKLRELEELEDGPAAL